MRNKEEEERMRMNSDVKIEKIRAKDEDEEQNMQLKENGPSCGLQNHSMVHKKSTSTTEFERKLRHEKAYELRCQNRENKSKRWRRRAKYAVEGKWPIMRSAKLFYDQFEIKSEKKYQGLFYELMGKYTEHGSIWWSQKLTNYLWNKLKTHSAVSCPTMKITD
ncbi:hypothetical protein HAX54_038748 [Datura stramonium]|uniref:Uncharacterized protein n=1 Tax=Datura stramonium TaxID=4076 RepID=A0ABS8SI90_DATST|nr:hypothetical protein [Datura stramonium]